MRIDHIIQLLTQERDLFFRAQQKEQQGRFYVLSELVKACALLEKSCDSNQVDALLSTLEQIKISKQDRVADVLGTWTESKPIFRVPAFPVTFNHEHPNQDLIVRVYHYLYENRDQWLHTLNAGDLAKMPLVRQWQEELQSTAQRKEQTANFKSGAVYMQGNKLNQSNADLLQLRIQAYVTASQLEQEAKLPAYQFISYAGGMEMCSLLRHLFEEEFESAAKWKQKQKQQVNWTYDDEKLPICKTYVGLDLDLKQDDAEIEQIYHDARIFSLAYEEERPSDLVISSRTQLQWQEEEIIPSVRDIVMSGRYAQLLSLLRKFP